MASAVTVTPSAGNAPFPTQGGVGLSPGFDAIDYRRFWSQMYVEGATDAAAWRVTEGAVNTDMDVTIASSVAAAIVQGDAITDQGLYYVAPHSSDATITLDPADATNPRVDRIVLQVRDDAHDASGFTDARIVPLTGTPTAGATKENAAGAVAVPDGAWHLCNIEVRAGVTAVTNSDILDFRTYALKDGQVGEIRAFGMDTLPAGWSAIDGGALRRDVHARLFAAIGTAHGAGDGSSTFNKPGDATPRALIDVGNGRVVGDMVGAETHQLTTSEMPSHTHNYGLVSPTQQGFQGGNSINANVPNQTLTSATGGDQPHNNMQPSLVARHGIFTGSIAV